jgi:tRNA(Phe) wybutosine-synthesizing methylase Tyw3
MVAVMDTQRVETIIAKDGKMLVSSEYIEYLTSCSNQKLSKSRSRIEKLRVAIEALSRKQVE